MASGIIGDQEDIQRRRNLFGKNKLAIPQIAPFHEILARQYEDDNYMFLIFAALAYFVISRFTASKTATMEVLTIYVGIFFATLLAAVCDYIKERQMLKIKDEINSATVIVYRGAYGNKFEISVKDIVVGDLIDVNQGDRVPADCVLIEECNMKVDESMYDKENTSLEKETSKSQKIEESEEYEDNHVENPNPFLLSGSKVIAGSGTAIVAAVGDNTRLSHSTNKNDNILKEQQTFLEKRLNLISSNIKQYALFVIYAIFAAKAIFSLVRIAIRDEKDLLSGYTLLMVGEIAIICVCLIIVAVPEGLDLAISIAMAMSVNQLKKD